MNDRPGERASEREVKIEVEEEAGLGTRPTVMMMAVSRDLMMAGGGGWHG